MSLAQLANSSIDKEAPYTKPEETFIMYLDSADVYLYRDAKIAEDAMAQCQRMLDQKVQLPDSLVFEFMLQRVYLKHSKAEPLEAYKIIMRCGALLDSLRVEERQIGSFNYLKAFTYMSVGDLAAAQKTYYENLELARAKGNTELMIQFLCSIGQLYNDEQNPEAAIKVFEEILDLATPKIVRLSTIVLINMEVAESYARLNKYDKALEYLEAAYEITEEANLQVLGADVLLERGKIYLRQDQISAALKIYYRLSEAKEGTLDQNTLRNIQVFRAKLYRAQKQYPQALEIYDRLLTGNAEEQLSHELYLYKHAYEISQEMGEYESALDYLITHNEIKQERDEDEKRQQTEYLKIKFETEQKDKENAILTAQILQKQTESKLLYSWMVLSCLVLFILFWTIYQKGKYSKRLESEVFNRTINLKKTNDLLYESNKELQEFNRILSHDLKEPLRSIIGFGQLSKKHTAENPKVHQYLDFVIRSGEQLQELINSIDVFQSIQTIDDSEVVEFQVQSLFDEILQKVQEDLPEKEVRLSADMDVELIASRASLKNIFEILIENAARYNEQEIVCIDIQYRKEHKMHLFEIGDNGIGIQTEYHDQIFEMFKRLNNRDQFKGSGMGLSIARKLITALGGELSLKHSTPNEGSIFLLSFPESLAPQKLQTELLEYSA
ncbi:MAG: ATP-binding protein [Bacteroidota bacterium]